MKRTLILILPLFFIGCATGPSAYGPVGSDSSLGFKHIQIEQDRFRVSFTGKSGSEAQDYALLRAAELTLQQGYSHFRVIDGFMEDHTRQHSGVSSSIGIGLGSGGHHRYGNRTNVDIGIGIHDVARALNGDRVTNSIEVKLLRAGSNDVDVYNAASVASSIKPSVFK